MRLDSYWDFKTSRIICLTSLQRCRQNTFDAEKDIYPSKNVFEDAKATANFLFQKGWTASFESFIDMITLFDDSRLDKVTIISCIQEWNVILQKYSDSFTADVHLQLLLEGCRLMLPNVSEEQDISKCMVPTAQRDVSFSNSGN